MTGRPRCTECGGPVPDGTRPATSGDYWCRDCAKGSTPERATHRLLRLVPEPEPCGECEACLYNGAVDGRDEREVRMPSLTLDPVTVIGRAQTRTCRKVQEAQSRNRLTEALWPEARKRKREKGWMEPAYTPVVHVTRRVGLRGVEG